MASRTRAAQMVYVLSAAGGGTVAYYRWNRKQSVFDDYPDFSKNYTLLAKVLTPSLYNSMHKLRSPSGWTVDACIQSGVDNPGDPLTKHPECGIVAGDVECYDVFAPLFDGMVKARHGVDRSGHVQKRDLSTLQKTEFAQGDARFVKSITLTTSRNLVGLPFSNACSRGQRREVHRRIVGALSALKGELHGAYEMLQGWDQDKLAKLAADGIGFSSPSSPWSSGMAKDWPDARGCLVNKKQSFAAWVCEESHLKLVAKQRDGNFGACFARLAGGLEAVEGALASGKDYSPFLWDKNLGYVSPNPSLLGTALTVEVQLELPRLCVYTHEELKPLLRALGLRMAPKTDLHTGSVWVSYCKPMKGSESEQVLAASLAVSELVRKEKELLSSGK
eukprot:TRINITY_DN36706_c0_g1_i1.p1 TRINITY_DN36706_c0_g1~~TRINITY_DN36706_c0_g1_i1.p1  ORF type:complete len:407 (+),score=69.58 TRINITY_DN36706_c0_g1_i1:53-1222(+)